MMSWLQATRFEYVCSFQWSISQLILVDFCFLLADTLSLHKFGEVGKQDPAQSFAGFPTDMNKNNCVFVAAGL